MNDEAEISGEINGQPFDPFRKQREAFRKARMLEPGPLDTMLEARRASAWIKPSGDRKKHLNELFGDLWRVGEVAVLFGDKGAGKSIFAVQLAETIARGLDWEPPIGECFSRRRRPVTGIRGAGVLYLDLAGSGRQFSERYSAESPIAGKPRLRCSFRFTRAGIEWDGVLPPAFKKSVDDFMRYSIFSEIERSKASVLIIDNISYLASNATSGAGCLRVMKNLKLWARLYDLSILVIASTKIRRKPARPMDLLPEIKGEPEFRIAGRDVETSSTHHQALAEASRRLSGSLLPAVTLADLPSSYIAQHADSVFALGHSTYSPDIRYVKHLASPRPITRDAANVLTYELRRTADTLVRTETASPFLGLAYLGPSSESDHLRDYAAEALAAEHAHQAQLKRIRARNSKDILVDAVLDGSYLKYLKGE